jgi:hypothetical protein
MHRLFLLAAISTITLVGCGGRTEEQKKRAMEKISEGLDENELPALACGTKLGHSDRWENSYLPGGVFGLAAYNMLGTRPGDFEKDRIIEDYQYTKFGIRKRILDYDIKEDGEDFLVDAICELKAIRPTGDKMLIGQGGEYVSYSLVWLPSEIETVNSQKYLVADSIKVSLVLRFGPVGEFKSREKLKYWAEKTEKYEDIKPDQLHVWFEHKTGKEIREAAGDSPVR